MFGLLLADEGAANVSGQDVDSESSRNGHVSVKAWLTWQDVHAEGDVKASWKSREVEEEGAGEEEEEEDVEEEEGRRREDEWDSWVKEEHLEAHSRIFVKITTHFNTCSVFFLIISF